MAGKANPLGRALVALFFFIGVVAAVFPIVYLILQSLAPWDQVDT